MFLIEISKIDGCRILFSKFSTKEVRPDWFSTKRLEFSVTEYFSWCPNLPMPYKN